VLAVGVERDDRPRALEQRVADAGRKRRTLAEIDAMANDMGAGAPGGAAGVVARPIVDHHDVGQPVRDAADGAADHRAFVEAGNDEPDVAGQFLRNRHLDPFVQHAAPFERHLAV
jgi:hypothetical protein